MKPINPLHGVVDKAFDAIDQAMITAVDEEVSDKLLATIAKAHVGVTKVEMIIHAIDIPHDTERVYADEFKRQLPDGAKPKPLDLPPLKKQPVNAEGYKERPGLGKKLRKPIEYDCATCHAVAGEGCFQMTGVGGRGKPKAERKKPGTYHQARYLLSKAANTKLRRDYDRQRYGEAHGGPGAE